jgi:DNA-binding transcriptional LysR family regulator
MRLLRELARLGTVAAVADALSYTPSAVSQQLGALEREAGVPLMRKAGRRVVLTAAGAELAIAECAAAIRTSTQAYLAAAGSAPDPGQPGGRSRAEAGRPRS